MKFQWFNYSPDPDETDGGSSTADSNTPPDNSSDKSASDGNSDTSSKTENPTNGSSDDKDDQSTDNASSGDGKTTTADSEQTDNQNQNDNHSTDPSGTVDPSTDNTSDTDQDTTSDKQDTDGKNPDNASSGTQTAAGAAGAGIAAPARPYTVESWRPLIIQFADDMPVEVLLRWIKHESAGNPCSTGKMVNGASIENGLFQLYSPDDDHFASPSQLHGSFCSGQSCTQDLTPDEAKIQVTSGIAYVKSCRERTRTQLNQQGLTWDESGSDFWSMVKMQHNLPSIPAKYIPLLKPSSWSEFKNGVIKQEPKYNGSSIFSNAEDIGSAA